MGGRWALVAAAMLVAAGCAGESAAPGTGSPPQQPAATIAPTPSTPPVPTATPADPAAPGPTTTTPVPTTTSPMLPTGTSLGGYLVIDELGVHRVDRDGNTSRLVDEAVSWAADDGVGGVIYRPEGDESTIRWLPADRDVPIDTGITLGLAGTTDQGPVIVTPYDGPTSPGPCSTIDSDGGEVHQINVRRLDLTAGTLPPDFLVCQAEGADDWYSARSYRDGYLLEIHTEAAAWIYHDRELVLLDERGAPVALPESTFGHPTDWSEQPRELEALLSRDAALLAVRQRLDNRYSNGPDPDTGQIDVEEWERLTASIPSIVRVVDIATGRVGYETQVPHGTELDDFDGRYLVFLDAAGSTVIDTWAEVPPTPIAGRVVLVSFDHTDAGRIGAGWPAVDPTTVRRGESGPWVSHLQTRLRLHEPGTSPATDGVFGPATEAAVIGFQEANGLVPDGIVGRGTWAALLATPDREERILRVDGIATSDPIDHRTSAAHVRARLATLFGTPDGDEPVDLAAECVEGADWVDCAAVHVVREGRILSWDALGLDVLLTDRHPDDPAATVPLHFGGWRLHDADIPGDTVVATVEGVRLGSTLGAVRRAHPELEIHLNEGLLNMFSTSGPDGGLLGWTGLGWEEQVRAIQRGLNAHGAGLIVDGAVGPRTQAAWDDFVATLDCAGCETYWLAPDVVTALGVTFDDTVVIELWSR